MILIVTENPAVLAALGSSRKNNQNAMHGVGAVMRSIFLTGALVLAGCSTAIQAPPAEAPAMELKLNQIQILGTHNSYALGIDPALMARAEPMMQALFAQMTGRMNPEQVAEFR